MPTKVLNQAVKRNIERFPPHYMLQLAKEELETWRSQVVTSNPSYRMGLRRRPYAFTEHGVAMLSAVLRSARAVQVSIAIIDTFVRLREMLASHEELSKKVDELAKSTDTRFLAVFKAMRLLSEETKTTRKLLDGKKAEKKPKTTHPIGFRSAGD